ncbi:MAG: (E)-4-hydroxy-3-methylbut-2-enyl-diphosphate synthase [Flavobacteriales bacterium]|nr:(E)-4-hydroxy-3-methylbut-2-enyl-diphosphate synthase [Flavobacteriales bacterium]MCB9446748.1 (E)-4-hydroxy-3-methylbut-2-enyl-diphosphate synthase [Flavobacteriales bacterium]
MAHDPHLPYCNNLTAYNRFITREVTIGGLRLGGHQPIRIQSMTTTDTMDIDGTVAQSIRMIEAGCELVRITAPSLKEAANLEPIKKAIRAAGFDTPLVADIHFTPNAAELAAKIVEKVRVNPGNYADKKKFAQIEYSDATYEAELERIRERFTPLVNICKEYGTAMRIGTNHGSLSDRIMSRYGDTPLGMVESALEFVRICEDLGYHEIVLSMKASNPQVMVQAYRLLVARMIQNGQAYPLHLGVTEAGDGEDGRIKSAVGIGTLLEDGLGDTIRVSLTEEPEFEIPVAQRLVKRYGKRMPHAAIPPMSSLPYDPFGFERRDTKGMHLTGEGHVPRVVADFSRHENLRASDLESVGYRYSEKLDKWRVDDQACDYLFLGDRSVSFELPGTLTVLQSYPVWTSLRKVGTLPVMDAETFTNEPTPPTGFVEVETTGVNDRVLDKLKTTTGHALILRSTNEHAMADLRRAICTLMEHGIRTPVIVKRSYGVTDAENFQLYASTDAGALLTDGLIDGIWLGSDVHPPDFINRTAFGILQSTRARISKTEYISCPSCGRTLFDLQETTAKIRARTSHLKGVKIGIMGCIVNGPGEMADADYGYVGTGNGVITLYKGKEVVKRNIPSGEAVDALIDLIKQHGDWVEAEAAHV